MCNCNNNINPYLFAIMQSGFMNFSPTMNFGGYSYPNSILPYSNTGFMPYYNFTNTTSQEGAGGTANNTNNSLTTFQNYMTRLGFTAANGYSVSQTSDGTLQFTYDNDGKTFVASSLPELMSKISTNASAASEKPSSLEDAVVAQTDKTDENEEVDETDKKDEVDNDDDSPDASDKKGEVEKTPAPKGKAKGAKHFSMPDLQGQKIGGKELEWKSYKNTSDYVRKNIKNNMSVDDLVKVMLPKGTDTDKAKYKQWVIDANPNGIKDGKVADVNKLDLPVYKPAGSNKQEKTQPRAQFANVVTKAPKPWKNAKETHIKLPNNKTTEALSYGKNYIYKEPSSIDSLDTDAVFVIDGHKYNLKSSGRTYDYWSALGKRTSGQNENFIDHKTGKFNPKANWTKYCKLTSDGGDGPLNDLPIKVEKGVVCIMFKGKAYPMNDVMSGNVKLTL